MHDHAHGHGHAHSHPHLDDAPTERSRQALTRALAVTLVFLAIEAAGGFMANSLALLSDAAHMLTDAGALSLGLVASWIARRPRTQSMSFGYQRAEILSALASGLLIWLLVGILIFEAFKRIGNPPPVNAPLMLGVAVLGLGANLFSMRLLHLARGESLNVQAAYLHVLMDALGSLSAVVAGGVIWLTGWTLADPLLTILFSVVILAGSWKLVIEAVSSLMLSFPKGMDPEALRRDLGAIAGVREVHDLHVWSVSMKTHALSAHVVVNDASQRAAALLAAYAVLEKKYGIRHATIQVEVPEEFDRARCWDCQGPRAGVSS